MPMFIVTYDVRRITPNPSTTLVAKAEALGWASWMLNSAGTVRHRLPTATLIGEFESMEEAKRAFDAAVVHTTAAVGRAVYIDKCFFSTCSNAEVRTNEWSQSLPPID